MENAWDAPRKGSASEFRGKPVLDACSLGERPARIPALIGVGVLDSQFPLQRRHSGGSGNPRVSRQVLRPSERHVLAVFHIGARRRAGKRGSRSEPAPLRNQKSYERTQHLTENKEGAFWEPSKLLKISYLAEITQQVFDK
jgi:hypothetical protein